MLRGCRWLVAAVLLACFVALSSCSPPATAPDTRPPAPDKEKDKVKRPSGEVG
jgi:hypothetical protein